MSKGNRIVAIRLSADTIEKIDEAIVSANRMRRDAPYDFSSWIRAAIAEKLAHRGRSKKVKRKGPSGTWLPSSAQSPNRANSPEQGKS